MNTNTNESPALICDLTAIPAGVRGEHVVTAPQLFAAAQEVRELPGGYAIRFDNEPGRFMQIARFIENERLLKGQFASLKEVLATNLATNRGLEQVRREIEHQVRKLPHIGTPLPKTWVRVREQLEQAPRNAISLDEYLAICRENGFVEARDALQLSGYLHDIGAFLHFQDEPLLRKTVILKPKWGTDAVYKCSITRTSSTTGAGSPGRTWRRSGLPPSMKACATSCCN